MGSGASGSTAAAGRRIAEAADGDAGIAMANP